MTSLEYLGAATAIAPMGLDPVQLFLDADVVVQLVILGLGVASIWSWAIIIGFNMRMGGLRKRSNAFEHEFWSVDEPETLLAKDTANNPSGRVASAGIAELRKSTKAGLKDQAAASVRIAQAMEGQVAIESDRLAERLNFLATTGSVAPFVGLFGTVWGIMNSFFQIGIQESSSLAVVAPGISEALFATAIGLFAAIPAVIAYNRFSNVVNGYEARLQRFADKVMAQVSREMESA